MRSIDREARCAEVSFATLLFRYLWPFWLFRDATRGDRVARAAAYRHNRSMRIHLPGYVAKWIIGAALLYAITAVFDALALGASTAADRSLHLALAAASGILFASSVCVLFVTGYIYLYLGKPEH